MKLNELNIALEASWRAKQSVELIGAPGIGKTHSVFAWGEYMSRRLGEPFGICDEHLSTMESIDLRGIPHKVEVDGRMMTVFSSPPIFPSVEKFPAGIPRYGVLFLDELRQAPHDVQKPAARVLDEGRMGDFSLSDYGHWTVIAASNRMKDKSGVNKEMAFIQNRKCVISIEPDMESWVTWADNHDIHPLFVAFAKAHPALVFRDSVPKEDGAFCSPRTLHRLNNVMVELGSILPDDAGLHHGLPLQSTQAVEIAAGLIGEATAATFMGFIRMADELTTFEQIISDPLGAKVPSTDRADALYAISTTCSYRVTEDTAVPVFKYLNRLPSEFCISALRTAIKKQPAITSNSEFTAWIRENSKLLIAVASV